MRYRSKLVFALVVVLALIGAACGGGKKATTTASASGTLAGTTITFSNFVASTEVAAIQEVVKKFEEQTGAKVNIVNSIDAATLPQKLQVEVSSGNHTIHLFAQDNLALATLVDKGLVEDLSGVQIPAEVQPSLIPPKFDGKQYFLPYRTNVRVTYVNKDRFSAAGVTPPQTTDQYKTVAEKLRDANGGKGAVTLSLATAPDAGPLGVTISEWVVSYGGDPLILNDQGSIQAFQFLQGMWKENDFAPESKQAKYDTEINYLRGETSWFATNWPFTTPALSQAGILSKFDVYAGWNGPVRAAHVIGGEVLGMPKGLAGKQKEAALALAQFIMGQQAQTILVAKNGWVSVRTDANSQVPADQKQTFDAANAALKDGWFRPNVLYWNDVQNAMADAVSRILYKGEDATTVLNDEHNKIAAAAQKVGATYPPASS
jgi:trehalose transport system substrate-binding protein